MIRSIYNPPSLVVEMPTRTQAGYTSLLTEMDDSARMTEHILGQNIHKLVYQSLMIMTIVDYEKNSRWTRLFTEQLCE